MNPRLLTRPALETLVLRQERELAVRREQAAALESRATLAEAGSREAWRLARSLMKRG